MIVFQYESAYISKFTFLVLFSSRSQKDLIIAFSLPLSLASCQSVNTEKQMKPQFVCNDTETLLMTFWVPRAPVGIAAEVFPVTRTLMAHALSIISDKLSCTVLRLPSSSRKVLILSDQTRQRTRLSVSCRFTRIVWDRNALSAEIVQLLKDTSLPFFRRNFINLPHVLLSLSLSRYLCLPLSISQRELMASMLFLFIFFFLSLSPGRCLSLPGSMCESRGRTAWQQLAEQH